jgi:imidazoleglycerol-phosphate dehydratase
MKRWIRETRETRIAVGFGPGGGASSIRTGRPFFDHLLATFAHHGGLALHIEAEGDLGHHIAEDVAITLGMALRDRAPEARARYGEARVAMDDALVETTLDTGGRVFYEGPLPSSRYDHVLRSLAENAGWTLHVEVRRGRDRHHVVEAAFKAVGLAVRAAFLCDGAAGTVFSTKGVVRVVVEEAPDDALLGAVPEATAPIPGVSAARAGRGGSE